MTKKKQKPKTELFKCPGCKKEEMGATDRHRWCKCDKTAPFRMVPISITKTVVRTMRAMGQIRRIVDSL